MANRTANVYGSLQGPPIPDSVDRENLPLGRQRLRIVKVQKEGPSKNKQQPSINVNYLVVSADRGTRGTAFFRYNFRHKPFTVGGIRFGSYFDPSFPSQGLQQLEKLAESANIGTAEAARKELNRARIALSTLKKVNTLAGLGPVHSFTSPSWVGLEFEGTVVYRDRAGNKARKNTDGEVEYVNKKGEEIKAAMFDETTAVAEISSIFAAPKESDQHEAPASEEPEASEETPATETQSEMVPTVADDDIPF
ncbi:MAG: hypothetical protein MN733_14170 [Nitrososphaera sp.]|nr:hypothetical protein [Nitrososphaera sp.]